MSHLSAAARRRTTLISIVLLTAGTALASSERTITSITGFDQGVPGPVSRIWAGDVRTMIVDAHRNILYLDRTYNVIRRIDGVTGRVTTVAGNGRTTGWVAETGVPPDTEGHPATETSLNLVAIAGGDGFTVDSRGILYIADGASSRVRAVNTNPRHTAAIDVCNVLVEPGAIRTIAGTGVQELGVDGVPATETPVPFPVGIEVDDDFNVYFSEPFNGRIRRIDAETGILDTFAGDLRGEGEPCAVAPAAGDGGPALAAQLCFPTALSFDRARRYLYISEWPQIFYPSEAGRVRRIDLRDQTIETFAGDGIQTSGGDGGLATMAGISARPGNITFDPAGNVFVAESSAGIVRRIDPTTGIITTVLGGRRLENGWTLYSAEDIGRPALDAMIMSPDALFYGGGRLYFADSIGGDIRWVEPDPRDHRILGRPSELIGEVNGRAGLKNGWAIAFDAQGNLFHSGNAEGRLLRIDRAGNVTTAAGKSDIPGTSGDCGGARQRARHPERCRALDARIGIVTPAFDERGDLYLADSAFNRVRRVDAECRHGRNEITDESTIDLVTETPFSILGIAIHDRKIYLGETFGTRILVFDQATGQLAPFAGTGEEGYDGDGGPALDATFHGVVGLVVDERRNALYITDIENQAVRRIDLATHVISTLVHLPDGCAPSGCFNSVLFLALDPASDSLYLNDDGNQVVLRIDLATTPPGVERFAGRPQHLLTGFSGDNVPATEALLSLPEGVAVDGAGKLHFADAAAQRVRRVGLVDVLPGEYPNVIRGRGRGHVEVAILATYDFSPVLIDASTLSVAGASIELKGNGQPDLRWKDVDGDGRLDLIFKVRKRDLGLSPADREATVLGATWTGGTFQDADWVTVTR